MRPLTSDEQSEEIVRDLEYRGWKIQDTWKHTRGHFHRFLLNAGANVVQLTWCYRKIPVNLGFHARQDVYLYIDTYLGDKPEFDFELLQDTRAHYIGPQVPEPAFPMPEDVNCVVEAGTPFRTNWLQRGITTAEGAFILIGWPMPCGIPFQNWPVVKGLAEWLDLPPKLLKWAKSFAWEQKSVGDSIVLVPHGDA